MREGLVHVILPTMLPNWNSFPVSVRCAGSVPAFHKALKTHYFNHPSRLSYFLVFLNLSFCSVSALLGPFFKISVYIFFIHSFFSFIIKYNIYILKVSSHIDAFYDFGDFFGSIQLEPIFLIFLVENLVFWGNSFFMFLTKH